MKNLFSALIFLVGFSSVIYCADNTYDPIKNMQVSQSLAFELYSDFYVMWNIDLFSRIAESKAVHKMRINEVESIIQGKDKGRVSELTADDGAALKNLYEDYLKRGSSSKNDALLICAFLEEQILKGLSDCLAYTGDKTSIKILNQMKQTTGSHLRAIVKVLNQRGEIYHPLIITEKELDNILGAGREPITSTED